MDSADAINCVWWQVLSDPVPWLYNIAGPMLVACDGPVKRVIISKVMSSSAILLHPPAISSHPHITLHILQQHKLWHKAAWAGGAEAGAAGAEA